MASCFSCLVDRLAENEQRICATSRQPGTRLLAGSLNGRTALDGSPVWLRASVPA